MHWWGDLFLNEGFATYFAPLAIDSLTMFKGQFHMLQQLIPDNYQTAMYQVLNHNKL